ncbi:MAG TPA: hypothetical protein VLZ89_04530 [Anaerolineales bacterium]|nr:hypothetical protein [Anaerolineales bacterium]
MDESLLEIRDYGGAGFRPLVFFGSWRVAILRYLDELQPDHIASMERHLETDEVFVLLCGRGTLILGGNGMRCAGVQPQPMEIGRIYNVKRLAWHTILLSLDASVLLVENSDTDEHNSEYDQLSAGQRAEILDAARRESFL